MGPFHFLNENLAGDGVIEHYPLDATSFSHVYPIDSLIMPHLHYYDAFTLAPIPVPPQYLETQYGIHVSLETTGGVLGAASEATLSGTAHVDGYTPIDTYSGAQLPWPGDPRMWDHTTGYPSVIDGHVLDVADMVANESCYPGYGQTVNYQLDWGDGSTEDHTVQVYTNEYTSHLYRHEGLYVVNARFENGSQSATMIGVGWVKTGLSGVAPQSVTPNSGVTVTATVHGLDIRDLLTDGGSLKNYAFVDWGDGLGKVPAQLTVDADGNGSVSAHYDHVPAGGLAGTLYVYDEHGNEFDTDFSVKADLPTATLTVGVAMNQEQFTPLFLHLPANFNAAIATFEFEYFASNPVNDAISGAGTDAEPYSYKPSPGDFTLWTKDGSGYVNFADLNNGGDFLDSGASYAFSKMPQANWDTGNSTCVFYIEAVGAPIDKAGGSISVSISAGVTPLEAEAVEPHFADTPAPPPPPTQATPLIYAKSNKDHGYDDAKQEIARKHGIDPNNWDAIGSSYIINDTFRAEVNELAPGKVRYYDNLSQAAAAAAANTPVGVTPAPKASASKLQRVWNFYTWIVEHPLSSTALLADVATDFAAGDIKDAAKSAQALEFAAGSNYSTGHDEYELAFKAGLQGQANTINGLQDVIIDLANLSLKVSPDTWAIQGLGQKLELHSPDWSKGLYIDETGSAHWWGKFLGGQGAFIILTDGLGLLTEAGEAAQDLNATAKFKLPLGADGERVVATVNKHWAEFERSGGKVKWNLGVSQGLHGGKYVDAAFRAKGVYGAMQDTIFLYGNVLTDYSAAAEEFAHWTQIQGMRESGITNIASFIKAYRPVLEEDVGSILLKWGFILK